MTSFTRVTDNVDDVLASHINQLVDGIQQIVGPGGWLENGQLSVTVASNNLTVALKNRTSTGNDATSTDPITFSTSTGIAVLSAALSVTKNAGTNWFNSGGAELATQEVDYFVYLGYNATDGVVIGFSRIPYARTYSDFSTTSTNEKYCAISTITNAAANDPYFVIGRFAATLSAGAGYTWTVPTFTPINLINTPVFITRELTWTPTWTNLTVGNGTVTAKYVIDQRAMEYNIGVVLGSTSTVGDVSHTLPFTAGSLYGGAVGSVPGTLRLQDIGVAQYLGLNGLNSTTSMVYRVLNASGTYGSASVLSSTVPFTWGTSDEIHEWARYFI